MNVFAEHTSTSSSHNCRSSMIILTVLIAGWICGLAEGLEANFLIDGTGSVFVDGIWKAGGTLDSLATFALPAGSQVIGVEVTNFDSDSWGITGSVGNIKTDFHHWKCARPGLGIWKQPTFDDKEWAIAVTGKPANHSFVQIDASADTLWAVGASPVSTVQCRLVLTNWGHYNVTGPLVASFHLDQSGNIFVDGSWIAGGSKGSLIQFALPTTAKVLGVECSNFDSLSWGFRGSVGAVITSLTLGWKCANSNPFGWSLEGFDDTDWAGVILANPGPYNFTPIHPEAVDIWADGISTIIPIFCRIEVFDILASPQIQLTTSETNQESTSWHLSTMGSSNIEPQTTQQSSSVAPSTVEGANTSPETTSDSTSAHMMPEAAIGPTIPESTQESTISLVTDGGILSTLGPLPSSTVSTGCNEPVTDMRYRKRAISAASGQTLLSVTARGRFYCAQLCLCGTTLINQPCVEFFYNVLSRLCILLGRSNQNWTLDQNQGWRFYNL